MSLSNRTSRTFLSISKGKISKKDLKTGAVETFDQLDGNLKSISKREVAFADGKVVVFDFVLEDGGEDYVLSVPAYGGVSKGIILSLANMPNPVADKVKIVTYMNKTGEYTNTALYLGGVLVKWADISVPAVETFTRNGIQFQDPSERIQFIDGLVATINDRIKANSALPAQPADDDLPMGADEFGADYTPVSI